MHTFVYARVSTSETQTVENQIFEIQKAGFEAEAIYSDSISGKVPAMERPEFSKLMDSIHRTKPPKQLIVTKIDRLGRDALDIQQTVHALEAAGCMVRVLQLGDLDLTSTAGRLIMVTLSAVAQMERDLISQRTKSSLQRLIADGHRLGRPRATSDADAPKIRQLLSDGVSVSQVARDFGVSRATVIRVRSGG